MNKAKQAWLTFKEYALSHGYPEKVAGDDAFTKTRSPQSPMVKLLGAKGDKIQVFETGKGRFELDIKELSGMNEKKLAESVISGAQSLDEASGYYRDENNQNRHYGDRLKEAGTKWKVRVYKTGDGFSIESLDGKHEILPGDANGLNTILGALNPSWPEGSPHKTWGMEHVAQLADTGSEITIQVDRDKFFKKASKIGIKNKKQL